MKKTLTQLKYAQIERDIAAIIARGANSLKEAYRRQALVTNWEVGRYLVETLPSDGNTKTDNVRMIKRLVKKFGRPDYYFYSIIKFYKLYPELPCDGPLTWSHYRSLLRIADPAERKKYERLAARKNISGNLLSGFVTHERAKPPAAILKNVRVHVAR